MSRSLLFSGTLPGPDVAWLESPCSRCPHSPCCRNLPLCNLPMQTRHDLHTALHLLRHRNLEIGLRENGEWTLFYVASCRFLDHRTSKCTIHGLPQQPEICKRYDPRDCWYKKVFTPTVSDLMMRLNWGRLDAISRLVMFDDLDGIYRAPSWERMREIVAGVPLVVDVNTEVGSPIPGAGRDDADTRSDWYLLFPPGRPTHRRHFDLARFRLGFPGVRIRVRGDSWSYAVPAPADPAAMVRPVPGDSVDPNDKDVGEPMTSCRGFGYHDVAGEGGSWIDLRSLDGVIEACEYAADGTITRFPAAVRIP